MLLALSTEAENEIWAYALLDFFFPIPLVGNTDKAELAIRNAYAEFVKKTAEDRTPEELRKEWLNLPSWRPETAQ